MNLLKRFGPYLFTILPLAANAQTPAVATRPDSTRASLPRTKHTPIEPNWNDPDIGRPEQEPVTTYDYNKSLIPQTSPALEKDTVTLSNDSIPLHSQDTIFKKAFPFFEKISEVTGGREIIGAFNKIETPKGTVKITSQDLGYPQLFIHYGKTGIFDRFDMNRDSSVTLTRMTPLGDPFKRTNASTPYRVLTFSYAGKPGSVEQTYDSFEEGSQIDVEESNPQPVPVDVRNFMPKRK